MWIRIIVLLTILLSGSSVLAVEFTVSSEENLHDDNNPGDGVCNTGQPFPDNCTLRAAIQEANALPGADRIVFDRHLDIAYPNAPQISDPLTIDGSSQWEAGNYGGRPGVGIGAGNLVVCADDTTITGLLFYGDPGGPYDEAGLAVECGDNVRIGGPGTTERNVFIAKNIGLRIGPWRDYGGETVTVQYNYFGVTHAYHDAYGNDNEYRMKIGIRLSGWGNVANIIIEHNLIGECRTGIDGDYHAITIRNNMIGHPNPYQTMGFNDRIPNETGIYITGRPWCPASLLIESNGISDNINNQLDISGDSFTIKNNQIGSYHTDYSILPAHGDGLRASSLADMDISDNTIINQNGNGMSLGYAGNKAEVKGNSLILNKKNGIFITSGSNKKSIVSSNKIEQSGENGILLDQAHNVVVAKNTIGVIEETFTGTDFDAGNGGDGIRIINDSTNNLIGGAVSEDGNRIGCNKGSGIYIGGSGTRENSVAGNILGSVDVLQYNPVTKLYEPKPQKAGNHQHGIALYDNTEANNIGLTGNTISPNLILDSHWRGIAVINSYENNIFGNMVGTDNNGRNWGNAYSGIQVVGSNNILKKNTVANNGYGPSQHQAGIIVEGASSFGNRITENSIFHNGATGIDLISGANQNLVPPQLLRNGKTISGTTYPSAVVEFFSGPEQDEGKVFAGSVQADSAGAFSWQINNRVRGKYLTATTTTITPVMNTSEFSNAVQGYIFPWPLFLPAIINQ